MTEHARPKMLDLFCGMGGWSVGFHREGFDCIGVDIVDVGYPYELVLRDITDLQPTGEHFDVVVASPPCTEYSPVTKLSAAKGQRGPPDPEKGNELVRHAMRIIERINPKFWALENVYGSRQHIQGIIGKPPRVEAKPFLLWGNFPEVMWPDRQHSKSFHQELRYRAPYLSKSKKPVSMIEDFPFDPLRSWKRARIPVWVAQTLAQACNHTNSSKSPEK